MSQLSPAHRGAAGTHAAPSPQTSFAAVQAAWRFFNNDRLSLPQLAEPLIQHAQFAVQTTCENYVLVPLDWCKLHFGGHTSKRDRIALAHSNDHGYELLTALALSDHDGAPLAPVCLQLRAADGIHTTRAAAPLAATTSLDQLEPVMAHVDTLKLGKPTVAIIDREADSVAHLRQWKARGQAFLVRGNDARRVLHEGEEISLGTLADQLKRDACFHEVRPVLHKGKPARQFVAETSVVLHRPARTHRKDPKSGKKKHIDIPGPPLPLRLIVSEIRGEKGDVLARWLLWTNLPASVPADTVALWYYWRWRIESYHKLLKSAGQEIESWEQETALALGRRLAVAAMSCVLVWNLARECEALAAPEPATTSEPSKTAPGALATPAALCDVLVRLSGRQMKRGKNARGFTEPALLAGLGILIPMLDLLEQHDLEDLRQMAAEVLPILTLRGIKKARPVGGLV